MSASEHNFETDVLISGENVDAYTAGEALTFRTVVATTDPYTVTEATDGGPATGVVAYDAASGEQVAVIKRDCEVRVEAAEALSAGDALTPNGSGQVRQAASTDDTILVANEDAGAGGELIEAEIVAGTGVNG